MITLDDVRRAYLPQKKHIRPTPLFPSDALHRATGCLVWLKAENLQRTGSFKIRGATSRLALLSPEERHHGVVAASAGNHAQGVALAASLEHVSATIVMPQDSPIIKSEQTQEDKADVLLVEGGIEEALARAHQLEAERKLVFIHPFDDPWIQAGQGSVGLEILADLRQVDTVVVPVGGGGLVSGIAVAVREEKPDVKIFGVQAEGADPARQSLREGRLVRLARAVTMADGIRVRTVAQSTLDVMKRYLEDVVTVTDEQLSRAMAWLLEKEKLVVEGAGAAGVAALLAGRLPPDTGSTVIVLSGGNADTNQLARVIERGLAAVGRYVLLRVRIPDRPGYLKGVLDVVAARRANILDIVHYRTGWHVPLGQVAVEMLLETRHPEHGNQIAASLREKGLSARLWDRNAYGERTGDD
ncbi:MAG: threonine ammonia-lyase [Acidobacteriota bacterium]